MEESWKKKKREKKDLFRGEKATNDYNSSLLYGTHLGESDAGRGHLAEVVSFENCKREK